MSERRWPGWINCGTLLGLLGLVVFAILAVVLLQILCHGPGGAGTSSMRYPGSP